MQPSKAHAIYKEDEYKHELKKDEKSMKCYTSSGPCLKAVPHSVALTEV